MRQVLFLLRLRLRRRTFREVRQGVQRRALLGEQQGKGKSEMEQPASGHFFMVMQKPRSVKRFS